MINWRSEKHLFSKTPSMTASELLLSYEKGCIPEYFPKVLNYKFRITENIERI